MWTPSYDIIVETLTGSEFEVTVNDLDTVGYIKSKIQKYEGIPVNQQHLLYKHKELTDAMVMKDIPLVNGSRLKLVLGLKGGPISSKRLVTISSDCDNWLDMSDVLSGEDLMNLQSPGLKLLLYKDNKKNVHRFMKVRAEKAGDGMKSSISRSVIGSGVAGQAGHGSGGGGGTGSGQMSQKERDIAVTKEKLAQIKAKLSQKKKRLNGGGAQPPVNGGETGYDGADVDTARHTAAMVSVRNGCDLMNEIDLNANASRSVYRHKKRHNQHYHHHHHHHHQQQQQQHQHLETVIKEEKCPIGYHRPTTGYDGSLHTSGSAGAAGGHRKSMSAVIDFGRQKTDSSTVATAAAPSFNYGLVNVVHGGGGGGATSARTHTASSLEQEKRSQIREHLQRNRSFKTISAKSLDFGRDAAAAALHLSHTPSAGLERSLSFHSNGILNRMDSELGAGGVRRSSGRLGAASTGSISASQARLDGRGRVGVGGGGCTTQSLRQLDEKVSSASLHDLIELLKFTPSRKQHRTFSNDALNKLVVSGNGGGSGGGGGCPKKYGAAGAMGKKSLPDINPPALNNIDEYIADYDIGMKASSGGTAAAVAGTGPHTATTAGDCKIASAAELAFKSGAHAAGDKASLRALYKSTSSDDGGTVYELPKLLVREDSPVESFLASYSQLETVATVRGDSPKNTFTTSTGSLEESSSDHGGGTTSNLSDSLLEVNLPHGATATTAGTIGDVTAKAKLASESLLKLAAEIAAESRSTAGASVLPSTISPPPGATLFGSNGSLISTPGGTKAPLISGGGGCSSSWCHHWNNRQNASYSYGPSVGRHHSELGINELELKFVRNNDRVATIERVELLTAAAAANGDQCGPTCDESNHAAHASDSRNVIKLPALSGLEINTGGRWLQMTAAGALRFSDEDDLGDDDEDDDDQEEDDDDDGDNEDEEHDADDFGEEDGGCDLVGQQVVGDVDEADRREERISSSSCSSIHRPRATSNSTSFIHSHLSISSDEDDLFSVAELGGGAGGASSNASGYRAAVGSKSKSIDLNEFRKAFGSSPTLLNALGTGTSVGRLVPPQLSRLETIPSQYRRGYTNLNDACLSSSTSELECVSNGAAAAAKKKLTTLLAPDGTSELSPLLKHRASNEHIAYVRSNENLNRYKALFAATPSNFGDGSARRRSSENGETVGGGGDALYLRHQRQSHGLGASAGGARHLPGIRDHLASIADSAEMVGDSIHGNGDRSTCSNLNDDELGRCFTVGGDFECRFSRLSCCSVANGGALDKSVSPRSPDGSRLVTGGGSDGAMRSDSSTVDDRNRMLFGGGGTVMDGGNGSSTPLRRQSDYYFPSDESLFNMDSFFDDFVEIDTSDIFDSAEFINISAPPLSHHRHLAQQNHQAQQQQQHHHHHHHHHHLGTRKSVSSSGLLLPDILHQQQQPEQPQRQPQHAGHHYQYLLSKDHQQHGPLRLNTADRDGDGIHFPASRRIAQMQQHHGPGADDIDLDDEPGIASIIQHIDREQLCDRGATTTLPPASRSVGNNNELGDRIATERLLRLPPRSDLGLFGSAGAVLTFPAEPLTDRGRDDDAGAAGQPHQQHHATEQIKSKKLRCAQCNKKLGVIMIMKCHCEKIFCAQHRYAEAHNCSYDFKLQGRKLLERENPLVVAEKLPKI